MGCTRVDKGMPQGARHSRKIITRVVLVFLLSLFLMVAAPEGVMSKEATLSSAAPLQGAALTILGDSLNDQGLSRPIATPHEEEGFMSPEDQRLAQEIEVEIQADPFIEHKKDIQIIVKKGVVYLRGTVRTWTEYAAATADAFQGGAREVKNQLEVLEESRMAGHSKENL